MPLAKCMYIKADETLRIWLLWSLRIWSHCISHILVAAFGLFLLYFSTLLMYWECVAKIFATRTYHMYISCVVK